jgi:phospholipid/cholesterol/gamma-HCH transport system substrate-binding protein
MRPKVSFMLVGAFVLLLGLAFVAGVVWLSSSGGDASYKTYYVYMTESVSGLNPNATVSYNGVAVGYVSDIRLDLENPQQVRVTLLIEEDAPVKVDTVATLASQGITGIANVELSGGTAESARLIAGPGEEYPVIQTRPSLFTRLDQSITGLVDELTGAAESLGEVADRVEGLLNEGNQQAIGDILAHVEEFTGELNVIAREVTTATRNVAEASAGLPGVVSAAERTVSDFGDSADSLEAAGDAVGAAADSLASSVGEVADGVNHLLADLTPLSRGAPAQLVHLVDELQLLSASLRRIAQDVERNPDMLLFGRGDQERGPGE